MKGQFGHDLIGGARSKAHDGQLGVLIQFGEKIAQLNYDHIVVIHIKARPLEIFHFGKGFSPVFQHHIHIAAGDSHNIAKLFPRPENKITFGFHFAANSDLLTIFIQTCANINLTSSPTLYSQGFIVDSISKMDAKSTFCP